MSYVRSLYHLVFRTRESVPALSLEHSEQDRVLRYVAAQREHHAEKSFAEEYREFLTENEMPIDEKYFLKE